MIPGPKISVLLPNYNNRPFLEERIRSVTGQTFPDWELVVYDSHSDDGSWEFFRERAAEDPRIKLHQGPREGLYRAWNECISLARGEYICIAPADDTMDTRFLEEMARALDRHPECGIAHCKLTIIDGAGNPHPDREYLWDRFYNVLFFGDLINRKHIRRPPHDGILHCGTRSVYTSITQLLIRKSLFEEVGVFETGFGSVADFEWGMRASLVTGTVHVPEYLAFWRVHDAQATDRGYLYSLRFQRELVRMTARAFRSARSIRPDILKKIPVRALTYFYLKELLLLEIGKRNNGFMKNAIIIKWLLIHPAIAREYLLSLKYPGREFTAHFEQISFPRRLLTRFGFENQILVED